MKKLYIKTFGCQMNVYDSERMADVLAPTGYVQTDVVEDADMVILNTCHIREKASEKVFSDLGRLRTLKQRAAEQQNRQMLIAVAGCVAQAEGEEITRRAPYCGYGGRPANLSPSAGTGRQGRPIRAEICCRYRISPRGEI